MQENHDLAIEEITLLQQIQVNELVEGLHDLIRELHALLQ
jgi:hypothetical protein